MCPTWVQTLAQRLNDAKNTLVTVERELQHGSISAGERHRRAQTAHRVILESNEEKDRHVHWLNFGHAEAA